MIINGSALLSMVPVSPMLATKETRMGLSYGLTEAGYDLRIKQGIAFCPKGQYCYISTGDGGIHRTLMEEDTIYIDGVKHLGRFILASTLERFTMPNNLVGVVHDKSTLARQGVSVFNTIIEPSWEGHLTLELVFHGNQPLTIHSGSGIAQVLFHELKESAAYEGKYQYQEDKPVGAKYK